MKNKLRNIFGISLFTVLLSGAVFAQGNGRASSATRDLYLISAKAGGVNLVEGKVTVAGRNKKSGYLLKGDVLEIGDRVATGADGKAEILLNPGSYIRLAENSSFEFLTTSLDDLQLRLSGGSAMFEVIADEDFKVTVNTPKAQFFIANSGVYRVNVQKDGSGKIAVWKGKAQIGDFAFSEVKAGHEASANGTQFSIAKFDRDEQDEFESWSKARAKDLAKLNSTLERRDLRNTLVSGFGTSRWNMYNSFGLWVFDASFGSYCFLPFGYGWSSPYGYNYGRDIWYLRLPRVIYNQPPPVGSGGTTLAGKSRIRTINPPYESVQNKIGRATFDSNSGASPFPSSPASSAPPTTARPASKGQRGF